MSLTEIEYGSIASSRILNNNFNYLESEVEDLASEITTKTAAFSSQVVTLNNSVQDLLEYRNSFIATGMILPFVGDIIPETFLVCDGSEVLISEFEDLYDVIGTTYGSTDSTSFCLPDLRNKTLWGVGENLLGDYISSKLPNLKGAFRLSGTEGSSAVSGVFTAGAKGGSHGHGHEPSSSNPLIQFDASNYNNIYSDECVTVQPPALAVKFIIKY